MHFNRVYNVDFNMRETQLRLLARVQETRHFFAQTLYRVATPIREVTWADFLLADVLTSLAKALSDLERALCHLLTGPVMQPHTSDQVCFSKLCRT